MLNKYAFLLACLIAMLTPVWANASTYTIEVIIFERHGAGGEAWSTHPGSPNFGLAKANLSGSSVGGKVLGNVASILRKKGTRVHTHVRWRQHVPNRNNKSWRRIGNQRVSGLISVSRGRYLHLNTDLLLRHNGSNYRIKFDRRMRSGEMHYLDHPKIGIITIAQRAKSTSGNPTAPAGPSKPAAAQKTTPVESNASKPAGQNSIPRATPDPS